MPPDNWEQTDLSVSLAFCFTPPQWWLHLLTIKKCAWHSQQCLTWTGISVCWSLVTSPSLLWDMSSIITSISASPRSSSLGDQGTLKGEECCWENIHMAAWRRSWTSWFWMCGGGQQPWGATQWVGVHVEWVRLGDETAPKTVQGRNLVTLSVEQWCPWHFFCSWSRKQTSCLATITISKFEFFSSKHDGWSWKTTCSAFYLTFLYIKAPETPPTTTKKALSTLFFVG